MLHYPQHIATHNSAQRSVYTVHSTHTRPCIYYIYQRKQAVRAKDMQIAPKRYFMAVRVSYTLLQFLILPPQHHKQLYCVLVLSPFFFFLFSFLLSISFFACSTTTFLPTLFCFCSYVACDQLYRFNEPIDSFCCNRNRFLWQKRNHFGHLFQNIESSQKYGGNRNQTIQFSKMTAF